MKFHYIFQARGKDFVKSYLVKDLDTFEFEVSTAYDSDADGANKKPYPVSHLAVCNEERRDLAIPVATYDDLDFTTLDEALMKEVLKAVIHSFENRNSHAIGDLRGLISFLDDCKELYE